VIKSLIDPPKTLQDRLRNAEFLGVRAVPLYGQAADEIDSLLLQLAAAERSQQGYYNEAAEGWTKFRELERWSVEAKKVLSDALAGNCGYLGTAWCERARRCLYGVVDADQERSEFIARAVRTAERMYTTMQHERDEAVRKMSAALWAFDAFIERCARPSLRMTFGSESSIWKIRNALVEGDKPAGWVAVETESEAAYKRIAALKSKLAAAEKDAARYRWLRDDNGYAPEESFARGGDDLDKLCDEGIAEGNDEIAE
jgi:hypothetical protein